MTEAETTVAAATEPRRAGGAGGMLAALLRPGRRTLLEMVALGALSSAFVAASLWVLRIPLMLMHDEAAYAVLARHWLSGTPDTGVSAHRAPLLPALGVPVLAADGGDAALQSIGILGGVVALLGVWWLGRMLRGPAAGLLAAAVFVFSTTVFEAGTQYMTDLPAAGLLVVMTALLWHQFAERAAPNRLLLLVAPLAWAAYELRYGSALAVLIVLATTAVMFRREVRASVRLVAATLGLLAVLLTPHLINSTLDLGSPVARLLYTSRIAGRAYLGEGLVDYVRWFPLQLAGPTTALLIAVGLVGAAVVWLTGRAGPGLTGAAARQGRALAFLVVPALVHVVAIGTASHGEPRFLFFAIALLCVAGGVIVIDVLAVLAPRLPALVWGALAAAVVVLVAQTAWLARDDSRARAALADRYAVLAASGQALDERAAENCSVLTAYGPQITWMTGCRVHHFGDPPTTERERFLTDNAWMLLVEGGKRQPAGQTLDYYLGFADPVASWDPPREGQFGWGVLYRLEVPADTAAR